MISGRYTLIEFILTMNNQTILLLFVLNLFLVGESLSQDSGRVTKQGNCNKVPDIKKSTLVGGPCEGCEAIFEYTNSQFFSTDIRKECTIMR